MSKSPVVSVFCPVCKNEYLDIEYPDNPESLAADKLNDFTRRQGQGRKYIIRCNNPIKVKGNDGKMHDDVCSFTCYGEHNNNFMFAIKKRPQVPPVISPKPENRNADK